MNRRAFAMPAVVLAMALWAAPAVAADGDGGDGGDDEVAVRQVFHDYAEALKDGQGDIAAFLVTAETTAFYAQAARAAVYAMPDELDDMPLVQQLLALRLREAVPAERLVDMTPEDLIGLSVSKGIVNPAGLRDLELGPVSVQGDIALAPQHDPWGRDLGVTWRFRKVQGTWHIDLRPSLMAANALLLSMQRKKGVPRETLLLDLVSGSIGRRVDQSLFIPPALAWQDPEPADPAEAGDAIP
jgi:hypothetical protein